MANYHKIHCTNCGKTVLANKMAVDVDMLIREYLTKAVDKLGRRELADYQELWDAIRFGMYMTKEDMRNQRLLTPFGVLTIKARDILKFLETRYSVNLQLDQTNASTSENSDFVLQPHNQRNELNKLALNVRWSQNKDASMEDKCRDIENAIVLLYEKQDVALLECTCEFIEITDDNGNYFVSQLHVTYLDNEVTPYTHMVCPDCGDRFYVGAGQYEEKVIVMLGSSRVGKTAYLAALVDSINEQLQSAGQDISVNAVSDRRAVSFKKNVLKLYREGKKIGKTPVERALVPLLSIQIIINGKGYVFTLVDMPGEIYVPTDEEEEEQGEASGMFIVNQRRICHSADAFWFCIDPVQIDRRLADKNKNSSTEEQVERDIKTVFQNIDNMLAIMGRDKKNIPTAVMLTKSDYLTTNGPLFKEEQRKIDYNLYHPDSSPLCLHENATFDVDELAMVATDVENYLKNEFIDRSVLSEINRIFSRKNFFALAAYGVEAGVEPKDIAPYGIALPFLWTLACMGYLKPVRKNVITPSAQGFFGSIQQPQVGIVEAECDKLFV
ncbi:MAG: hypothetical protein K2L07_11600 [Lachnospiraceae bacterium]|nr:hypothetical protein [Lachnospiraceae bacterium]